jgi:hypothetical protein
MQPERKTAVVMVRMRPSTKAAAEQAAVSDERSLSSLIEKLLLDYLRERGHLPALEAATQPAASARKPRQS